MVKTLTSAVIFDPVGVRLADVLMVDAIVVTHEHYDHFEAGLSAFNLHCNCREQNQGLSLERQQTFLGHEGDRREI